LPNPVETSAFPRWARPVGVPRAGTRANIGGVGSGNYVKMVHNGIEYGDMQMIAESYDLLKRLGGLSTGSLGGVDVQEREKERQKTGIRRS